ncbi:MAG: efflux transporter outer membrane subunit [Sedimentisphaerales bacterium]|nr:efflux transporter outer membrane subunit [Sedimentisphaerales bacterium]
MKNSVKTICYRFLLCVTATLTGCMVGPDYQRPPTPADEGAFYNTGRHKQDVNQLDADYHWWERFADDTTTEIVTKALENNYNLKAAAARVLQAQAILAEAKGRQLPEISYGLSRDRRKTSFDFGTGRMSALTTTYSQNFSVSYVLDLFGKLKHAERAAWADMLASKATQDALINSVIASVINSRIQIATLTRRLQIAQANTESRRSTLDIVERRYKQGLVGPVDVRLARENLAASQSAQTSIELSLATAHHSLDVLLGRRPGSSQTLPDTLADLPDLQPIPVGLPASLLDRRPDIIASEMSLKSSNERIGVSIAQLYPDLTLTGTYGGSAGTLRDIFRHEAEVYGLVMNLAQPIFKGGQLKAAIDSSKARYAELAANYAQTILIALREVEDALVTEQKLKIQLEQVRLRFAEAKAAEDLSRDRYGRGVETILTVLESERRRRGAEEELALLKGQIWTNRVNLFLALGGDWVIDDEINKTNKNDKKTKEQKNDFFWFLHK